MRTIRLAAALTLLGLVQPSIAANYTQDQIATNDQLYSGIPLKCILQLPTFQVCDDDCLAGYKTRMEKSPNCTVEGRKTTALDDATKDYESCQQVHGLTIDRYMPLASRGTLAKCTPEQKDSWYDKYGIDSFFSRCWSRATPSTGCSDSCLSAIEQGVSAAPICADVGGYWYGEVKKEHLVRCLKVHKDKLEYNVVLNTVVNADGSKTVRGKDDAKGGDASASTSSAVAKAVATAGGAALVALVAALV